MCLQEELVKKLTREKAEQLRSLSSQLFLFESRLCKKQKEIETSLTQRETIILRQQRVIKQLQHKLRHHLLASGIKDDDDTRSNGDKKNDETTTKLTVVAQQQEQQELENCISSNFTRDSPTSYFQSDPFDSLGDSDSAVVLEENLLDDPTPPRLVLKKFKH